MKQSLYKVKANSELNFQLLLLKLSVSFLKKQPIGPPKKIQALSNVSLDIQRGKITTLIGPSGCGKSTLLRALNRMHDFEPSSNVTGKVFFISEETGNELNIYGRRVDDIANRKRVGMLFQEPNPFPKSIYENVAFGLRILGINRKSELDPIVKESLKRAGLWSEVKDELDKSATKLSGGQQQRLCFARALALDPEVLLLDEPTSKIDPIGAAKVEKTIENLARDGVTIVMVTHNYTQAKRFIPLKGNTAFFLNGEIIEVNSTEELFERPSHPKTREYLAGVFG